MTESDLAELERMLLAADIADADSLNGVKAEPGLGVFLRSLTGFDRAAAKDRFSNFVAENQFTANQNIFLDLIIDSLCENGAIDPSAFYESPFTDIDEMGIGGIFQPLQTAEIIRIVEAINGSAAA